ncbi:MAG: hypothetical protein LBR71_00720, partial [Synergistaceae bacterium]|nr:hypothetical protein [Synergistaceae bacterium]
MAFELPEYRAPSFQEVPLQNSPDARTAPVERDGVAPAGYHATSVFPEYFKIGGAWLLPKESRMDCVVVVREEAGSPSLDIVEFRRLKRG